MKDIKDIMIIFNDDAKFNDFKNELKINPKCKVPVEAQASIMNGAKINFMLDNISIEGDEYNRAFMILLRPLRVLNIGKIEYDDVKGIYGICMMHLKEIVKIMSFDKLASLSSPFPAYTKDELDLARKIYDEIKKK